MKEKLTSNLMLKIGSVFVAALLWMVVFNSTDPIEKKNIVLDLKYLNEEALQNENLVLSEGPKTTEIWVQAQRSKLSSITSEDFEATVDLNGRVGTAEDRKTVEINVSAKKNVEWGFASTSSRYPQIVLDKIITKEMELIVVQEGELQEGYQMEQELLTPNPSSITVKGPEKQFSNVASAKVVVDLSKLSDETSYLEVVPILCDSNGQEISISKKDLVISPEVVTISTGVMATKKVPIVLEGITGEVDDEYVLKNTSLSLKEVYIGGTKEEISKIENIVIPKSFVNVEGLKENQSFNYDLQAFCREHGVTLLNKDSNVEIKVEVEALLQKRFQLTSSNIMLRGKNNNYNYRYTNNSVLVTLKGVESELSSFNTDEIRLQADVSNLEIGTHRVVLQVTVKDTLQVVQEVWVEIDITQKTQSNTTNTIDSSSQEVSSELDSEGTVDSTIKESGSSTTESEVNATIESGSLSIQESESVLSSTEKKQ